jgi:putative endonuclease
MQRGPLGETLAELYLVSRGWTVRGRNVRAGRREIDLVVQRGETVAFVEVKWRRAEASEEAWRPEQRRRAGEAALALLERWPAQAWRFDLVTIQEEARGFRLLHHAGAWSPGGSFW